MSSDGRQPGEWPNTQKPFFFFFSIGPPLITRSNPTLHILSLPRYYGDLQWYAPDGVDGDKKDTLLMIAVKTNNVKLVEWMLTLDGLDTTKQNGKGLNAMAVAKAIGRENLLLGMAACDDGLSGGVDASEKSAASAADPNAPPLPPDKAAADEAGMEVARLRAAMKMLKVMTRRDWEARSIYCVNG